MGAAVTVETEIAESNGDGDGDGDGDGGDMMAFVGTPRGIFAWRTVTLRQVESSNTFYCTSVRAFFREVIRLLRMFVDLSLSLSLAFFDLLFPGPCAAYDRLVELIGIGASVQIF